MDWWKKVTGKVEGGLKPLEEEFMKPLTDRMAIYTGKPTEPIAEIHAHLWDGAYAAVNQLFTTHGSNHDATTMAAVAIVALKGKAGVEWDKAVLLAKQIDPFR